MNLGIIDNQNLDTNNNEPFNLELESKFNTEPHTESNLKSKKQVVGKIKKFSQKLYNKYDIPARNIVKELLTIYVKDNPNIYEQDMILNIPDSKYKYLELQVCTHWVNEKYPYKLPFVYARKQLFSDDTLFLIFNKHMTSGLLFDRKSLLSVPRRLKKYSRTYVYEAPWHRVFPVNFDNFDIETIQLYY